MNIICTICARGGSQGVPKKNIRLLADKPLIAHTIIQAQQSELFQSICVSSDSDEILSCAEQYNINDLIKRPEHLATSEAPKLPVIQHAVLEIEKRKNLHFDIIVDLDPTSPLRDLEDIKHCIDMLMNQNATNIITASPAKKSPYFNMVELDDRGIVHLSKNSQNLISGRQYAPKTYDMNASIYVWWRKSLLENNTLWQEKTMLYVMPIERSIDIDNEIDFTFIEFLASKYGYLNAIKK